MSALTAEHQSHRASAGASHRATASAELQPAEAPRTRGALLAHDLKNPLAVIRARAQLLQRRMGQSEVLDREQILEGLAQIEAATARMAPVLDELIGVPAPTGRPDEPDGRKTDLLRMARALVSDFQQTSDRHRFRLQVPPHEIVGRWQPVHVERILSNLLANAIKYSPRGGEITLAISEEIDPDDISRWALVRVIDNGIGIPPDELQHVFELRHRAANARSTGVGTGMGLAAVRQLVGEYQGTVSVESEEGRGSSFSVRLPLEPPAVGPCKPSSSQLGCMLLHIEKEERDLLTLLLQEAVRKARQELSISNTDPVKALIEPREALLSGMLKRVQAAADPGA